MLARRYVLTYQPKPCHSVINMEVPVSNTLPSAQNDRNHTENAEQDGDDQDGLCKACGAQGARPRRGENPLQGHGLGSSGDSGVL